MNEAKKLENTEEPEERLEIGGSKFDPAVIKEAIQSSDVFFQLFNEDLKRRKVGKSDA